MVFDGRSFLHSWLNDRRSSHLASDDSAPPKAHMAANKNTRSIFCPSTRQGSKRPHTPEHTEHACFNLELEYSTRVEQVLRKPMLVHSSRRDSYDAASAGHLTSAVLSVRAGSRPSRRRHTSCTMLMVGMGTSGSILPFLSISKMSGTYLIPTRPLSGIVGKIYTSKKQPRKLCWVSRPCHSHAPPCPCYQRVFSVQPFTNIEVLLYNPSPKMV